MNKRACCHPAAVNAVRTTGTYCRSGYVARPLPKNVAVMPSAAAAEAAGFRSRRAHFARSLLDDTDLSMTQIAFAAGFGSVRRMNDVMLEVFKFPPTALRSKRRLPASSSIDGGLQIRLGAARPVPFSRILEQLRNRCVPGVEVIEAATYRRTTMVCGRPGVVEMTAAPDERELVVSLDLPTLAGLTDEVAQCRRVAGLDEASGAPSGVWDPFEAEVKDLFFTTLGKTGPRSLASLASSCGHPIVGAEAVTGGCGTNRA